MKITLREKFFVRCFSPCCLSLLFLSLFQVIWQEAASNSGSQKSASGVVEAIVKFTLDRHSPSFALRAPSPSPFSTASSSSSPRSGLVHFVGSQLEDVLLGTDGAPVRTLTHKPLSCICTRTHAYFTYSLNEHTKRMSTQSI